MSKNILVTGGAGFIGSHLCEQLLQQNHNVTSLDNYFTGSVANHIPGVRYMEGSTELINSIFTRKTFDCVFHLGEYSRVEQSFDAFDTVWQFNKLGTYEVLKYVRNTGAKLVYAGSSTKYADHYDGYVPSPYTWSKASNTELVNQFGEWYDINYAITYFYNVYGKREIKTGNYATLIAKFKEKMRNNEPLTVVTPGTQLRNFTHIDDIVNALILVGEHGKGDEYGIGNPTAYSVLDVANLFGGQIEMLPPRQGNRLSAKVIIDKTRELGWEPKYDLNTYIETLRQNGWRE